MSFLVILVYGAVAYFQIKDLKNRGYRRDVVAFSIFLVISFVLSLLYTLGILLPSPLKGIHYIMNIFHLHY